MDMWNKKKTHKKLKKNPPNPGIEPGPPGWKPGILTTRPIGTCVDYLAQSHFIPLFANYFFHVFRFRIHCFTCNEQVNDFLKTVHGGCLFNCNNNSTFQTPSHGAVGEIKDILYKLEDILTEWIIEFLKIQCLKIQSLKTKNITKKHTSSVQKIKFYVSTIVNIDFVFVCYKIKYTESSSQ